MENVKDDFIFNKLVFERLLINLEEIEEYKIFKYNIKPFHM